MIELRGVRKEFGAAVAVAEASFRVERGEIVGLLGPNGSGKTTIMRVISGFFAPTSGTAQVAGLDVQTNSLKVRKHIGYLPENVAPYPDLSVQRYLHFCAEIKGVSASERPARVETIISDTGLGEVRRKQIRKLSKGYRQRVGIAQALVHSPDVLILDEPTVGLDPQHVVEIRELIRDLRKRSTIVLSTHILSEAASLCDRVVILDRGHVLAADTAARLQARLEATIQTLIGVHGPNEEVIRTLGALPGVESIEDRTVSGNGTVQALVVSRSEDVRQAAAKRIIECGWTLVEVTPVRPTLEDLFVRLVKEQRSTK